jgi:probable rRNA maturation factor
VRNAAHSFLRELKKNNISLDIYLVGTRRMRALHRDHLGKDTPTNVLAFEEPNFPQPDSGGMLLGEIYICPPYIREHGEDINYMLLHGLMHLLGFNHKNKSDRMIMEKREEKLMKWLNRKS